MVEPQRYYLSDNITEEKLVKAGFLPKQNNFVYSKQLYDNYVYLKLEINRTDHYYLNETVLSDDGSIYYPFYNHMGENLICDEATKNYNKYMNELVSKGILYHETSKSIVEYIENDNVIIKIKYSSPKLNRLELIGGKSDWIDLRAAENVEMKAGEFKLISLGVAMKLPDGYEAHVVPRSSTFKNFGVLQTNHMGVIDNSYCGDNDIWKFPAYAIRDTKIRFNDRICQFRIVKKQPTISFKEVNNLGSVNRGGFGSTGKN